MSLLRWMLCFLMECGSVRHRGVFKYGFLGDKGRGWGYT